MVVSELGQDPNDTETHDRHSPTTREKDGGDPYTLRSMLRHNSQRNPPIQERGPITARLLPLTLPPKG